MKILVMNCGSSSIKYQLLNMDDERVLAKGLADRVGLQGASLTHYPKGKYKIVINTGIADHGVGIKLILAALTDRNHGVLARMSDIDAIGHRVAHGGEKFTESALITPAVKDAIVACYEMAPLHNPANMLGIEACEQLMRGVPQVAVFDTAFHQTMPKYAYIYGLPYEAYEKYAVRRYGFHGTSHKYVADRAAALLGGNIAALRLVTCHLGNGASIAAVKHGKSVDTSMGFTPLEGLVMGTRCGEIDPGIIPYLMKKKGFTPEQMDAYLNKQSGIFGISGISSDFRDIEAAEAKGHERAHLALEIFAYKVRRFIGGYAAAMNGVDAIVFTGGVGENRTAIRKRICNGLEYLGTSIDAQRNSVRGREAEISTADSKVKILVIPTNEELVIARDTQEICRDISK